MIQISEVDPADDVDPARLLGDRGGRHAARPAARPAADVGPSLTASLRNPNPYYRRTLWVARDGDEVVGCAEVSGALQDNTHIGFLDINVLPAHRRHGIGTRAVRRGGAPNLRDDGRTSVCGETYVPADAGSSAGLRLRQPAGLRGRAPRGPPASSTCRSRPTRSSGCAPRPTTRRTTSSPGRAPAPTSTSRRSARCARGWRTTCPPVRSTSSRWWSTEERLRTGEAADARCYDGITAVARRRADGVFGGYTQLYLPTASTTSTRTTPSSCPSTAVTGSARSQVRDPRDRPARAPERVAIHTDTAVDNHAMQATNRDFGFRPVERLHEMQRRDG